MHWGFTAVPATLLLAVVAAGCGNGGDSQATSSTPPASKTTTRPSPTTPEQRAGAIEAAVYRQGSVQARYEFRLGGGRVPGKATISCRKGSGCAYEFASEDVMFGTRGRVAKTRVRVIGDSIYFRPKDSTTGNRWVQAPLVLEGQAAAELHFGVARSAYQLMDPRTAAVCLRNATEHDGKPAKKGKYSLMVDVPQAAESAPERLVDIWGVLTEFGAETVRCTVSVDEQYRPRRLKIELEPSATSQGFALETSYRKWGGAGTVTPPPAGQVDKIG